MVLEGETRDILDANFSHHNKTWHSKKDLQAGITLTIEGGDLNGRESSGNKDYGRENCGSEKVQG